MKSALPLFVFITTAAMFAEDNPVPFPEGRGGWVQIQSVDLASNRFTAIEREGDAWLSASPKTFLYNEETIFSQTTPVDFSEIKIGDPVQVALTASDTGGTSATNVFVLLNYDIPTKALSRSSAIGVVTGIKDRTLTLDAGGNFSVSIPADCPVSKTEQVEAGEVLRRANRLHVTRIEAPGGESRVTQAAKQQ